MLESTGAEKAPFLLSSESSVRSSPSYTLSSSVTREGWLWSTHSRVRAEIAVSAVFLFLWAGDVKTDSASLSTLSETNLNSEENVELIFRNSSNIAALLVL